MSRHIRTFVLGSWAAFFVWLLITNEKTRYLGPRTYWIIPFGLATLTVTTVLSALRPRRVNASALLMLIPIVAVIAIPSPELGALAASRKSTSLTSGFASFVPVPKAGDDISFVDVHYASESDEYAATLGISEGLEMDLTGFVTHGPDAPDDGFDLTRFYVSCCAADAIPYSVRVKPSVRATGYEDDTWLRIRGRLAEDADGFFLVPRSIEPVPVPEDPYLY